MLIEVEVAIGDFPTELRELETRLCLCLCDEPLRLLSVGGVMVETAKNSDRRNSEGVLFALLEWHFSV